jgi:hypothetical protein
VFRSLSDKGPVDSDPDVPEAKQRIETTTIATLDQVTEKANKLFGTDVYLASVFKNLSKCRQIAKEIR